MLLSKRNAAEKPQQLMDKKPWASWAVNTSDVLVVTCVCLQLLDKKPWTSWAAYTSHLLPHVTIKKSLSSEWSPPPHVNLQASGSFWHVFWHFVWHLWFYLGLIPTFCSAYIQTVCLTYIMSFHLACVLSLYVESAGIPQSKYAKRTRGATFVSQFSVFSLGL